MPMSRFSFIGPRFVNDIIAKLDRLISDVEKLDRHVDGMRSKISRAEGVVICGVILLSLFSGVVWWLIGGQINSLRDQLMAIHSSESQDPSK